ncbi:hypothetical protein MASR2M64_08400 [Candidatus Cloacimonadota bacterium]
MILRKQPAPQYLLSGKHLVHFACLERNLPCFPLWNIINNFQTLQPKITPKQRSITYEKVITGHIRISNRPDCFC